MANNRMYLRCPQCPDAKPLMLAKYYPSTGWYAWTGIPAVPDEVELRINEFFQQHRHDDNEWGNRFDVTYEIAPDPEAKEDPREPFPLMPHSHQP